MLQAILDFLQKKKKSLQFCMSMKRSVGEKNHTSKKRQSNFYHEALEKGEAFVLSLQDIL